MRYINLETWPRREHFGFFSTWDYPHFSMCANVDLTTFYPLPVIIMLIIALVVSLFLSRTV